MTMDIYLFFMFYLAVAVSISYKWGEEGGRKRGQQDMVIDMLDRKLVTEEQLKREYVD